MQYAGTANASNYANTGESEPWLWNTAAVSVLWYVMTLLTRLQQDKFRTANLHSWTTEFDGQPNREQRYWQESGVVSAHPVTFERKVDPNK